MFCGLPEKLGCAFGGIVFIPALFEASLMGRAPNKDLSFHGMAEVGEVTGILQSGSAKGVVRTGEMKALAAVECLGFGKKPVEPDDFESVIAGNLQVFLAVACGEISGIEILSDGEGGDLKSGVSEISGGSTLFSEGSVLESFVAKSEFHRDLLRKI